MKRTFLFTITFMLFLSVFVSAQHNNSELPTSINDDGAAPDNSAILDLQSTDKGLLIPRMNMVARDLINSPATGLLIYQTDNTPGFYYFSGASWIPLETLSTDDDPLNELNISAILNGTELELTDNGGTLIVDLSNLQNDADADPTNEYNTSIALNGTELELTDSGGTLSTDLASLQDGVDDADNNPLNELQDLNLSGNILSLTDDASDVDLSAFLDNTDAQTLSLTGNTLDITGGNSVDLSPLIDDGDWEISSGTNITNVNEGNVGIGNMAPTQNRWQLTVKDTSDCMLGTDSVDVSELFAVLTRNLNENNTGVGIGFQSTTTVTGMGQGC